MVSRSGVLVAFGVAIVGCGKSNINVEAPGLSVHASSEFLGAHSHDGDGLHATGDLMTETRTVTEFHAIEASSGIQVKYVKAANRLVNVTAQANVLDHVTVNVEGGVLHLEVSDNLQNTGQIIVAIANPKIDQIHLEGGSKGIFEQLDERNLTVTNDGGSSLQLSGNAGDLEVELGGGSQMEAHLTGESLLKLKADGGSHGKFSGKLTSLDVNVDGGSVIDINGVQASDVKARVDGGARLTASGTAKSIDLHAESAAQANLEELVADNCQVDASGASHAQVNAKNVLSADVNGASQVQYSGTPSDVKKNVDDSSQLAPL